ncbi:MAG: class I SAM-dependent DNA methyltransferase [Kiritimatiellia bacterium]|jgi:hypothetical protein|nr:class I SAM-dependent DNA methyltransferase [Kiritimatiellia bacterium]
MPISWNEIRQNAIRFSREWAEECREDAEAKSFWDEFFQVFGVRRRLIATFEERVKNIKGQYGFIDVFWRGLVLAEHKSRGKSLDQAESQAFTYYEDLAREGRTSELPRYVILSDFERIVLYDLDPDEQLNLPLFSGRHVRKTEFPLKALHKHIQEFAFIAGYKQQRLREEDPVNIRAVEILDDLHDALADGGYAGHDLERFLVRILFCLFAEDTGLFDRDTFTYYLENRTAKDGSDLGLHLAQLFEVLDMPPERRQTNLDEMLAAFPYVNGALFSERLAFANFNRDMRDALLRCTEFDWSQISPAVFGSLFQGTMDGKERRQTGGHYTSERDILKVINALFMDGLRAEFEKARRSKAMLRQFHGKLGNLRFFDPACGCGNFLVITYRELRLLEIEVLKALFGGEVQLQLNVQELSRVDVDAYTGIEILEWPARIAEVAMWLMDHQMNMRLSEAFGQYFVRLPLRKSANIVLGNALRLDWKAVLPPDQCSYVLGNPPFIGAKFQDDTQRADLTYVAAGVQNCGLLDYVTGWYFKAADYIQGAAVCVGFVSTNSISQGEQVGVLWNALFRRGVKIHFAFRTFPWASEARGKAHVHVVIIGFATFDIPVKRLCEDAQGTIAVSEVRNISPYLIEGGNAVVVNRSTPLCGVPEIGIGNKPIDGGNYLFKPEEKAAFLKLEPDAAPFFRRWIGSDEFINSIERWCLWLGDCPPARLRQMPHAMQRVEAVRDFRLASKSAPTRKIAATPTRFHVENFPQSNFLVVPGVSSERRPFIPIGYLTPDVIASNLVNIIPDATLYHFGVLTSTMHMAWMRQVCGRLKSDYRYSAGLVYNNFPWPEKPAAKQREAVEAKAQAVLDARAKFPLSTLADLYDPVSMPAELAKAHAELDRAVERCYRPEPFASERQRVEFLFALYERYTAPLLPAEKTKGRRARGKIAPCAAVRPRREATRLLGISPHTG